MGRFSWMERFGLILVSFLVLMPSLTTGGGSAQSSAQLAECWADLASEDAARAYRAVWLLTGQPDVAVNLLRENLKPPQAPEVGKIEAWLADLSHPKFAVRDKAYKELEKQGELAEAALRKALEAKTDLESRQRIQALLDRLQGPVVSADKLRLVRALEVLELIGGDDAKLLLRELVKSFAGSQIAADARETLQRLEQRAADPMQPEIKAKVGQGSADGPLPKGALFRIGTKLFRQEEFGSAHRLAVSPDGKVVASAGTNNFAGRGQGNIYLWEAQTGKLLSKKNISAECLAFAPKGRVLAVGLATKEQPGGIMLWDITADKELARTVMPGKGSVEQIFFSPDGKQLICKINDKQARKPELRYLNAQSLEETKQWMPDEGTLNAVAPDGIHVVVQPKQGDSQIWNLQTGSKTTYYRYRSASYETVFSQDSGLLAGKGAFDVGLRIWDVKTGKPRWVGGNSYHAGAFSADQNFFATSVSQFGAIAVWNPQSGAFLRELPESQAFGPGAISVDSRLLAGVCGKTVRVWDLNTGQRVPDGDGHYQVIERITFLPALNAIATSADDGTLRFWDAASGKQTKLRELPVVMRIADCAISPDGKQVAVSDMDGNLNVWDIATSHLVYKFPGHGRLGVIKRPVQFSADGRYLTSFSSNDFFLRKWDLKNGRAVVEHRIRPTGMRVPDDDDAGKDRLPALSLILGARDAAFTHGGEQLVLVSDTSQVHFFDIATGKESRVIGKSTERGSFSYVSLSPTSKHYALVSRGPNVTLFDWASGKSTFSLSFPGDSGKAVFSPDGRTLAVVSDKKVQFVEVASGKVRHRLELPAHCGLLTYSPFGRHFVTALDDTTALVWEVASIVVEKQ